jgi:hypothetical protein
MTKVLAQPLHPDSVYQGMVKHYGGMVGIKADVQGFCAKLAPRHITFIQISPCLVLKSLMPHLPSTWEGPAACGLILP